MNISVWQVLKQCDRWCPHPEAVFASMREAAAAPAAPQSRPAALQQQQTGEANAPQWGWDDLKYAAGDELNTGESSHSPAPDALTTLILLVRHAKTCGNDDDMAKVTESCRLRTLHSSVES